MPRSSFTIKALAPERTVKSGTTSATRIMAARMKPTPTRSRVARAVLPRELLALRTRMDRLNRRLRDLIQERARLALAIARVKRAHGLPVVDRAREAATRRAMLRGAGHGFDRKTLARLVNAVLDASRQLMARRH